jgi:hypothetical protein
VDTADLSDELLWRGMRVDYRVDSQCAQALFALRELRTVEHAENRLPAGLSLLNESTGQIGREVVNDQNIETLRDHVLGTHDPEPHPRSSVIGDESMKALAPLAG